MKIINVKKVPTIGDSVTINEIEFTITKVPKKKNFEPLMWIIIPGFYGKKNKTTRKKD